MVDTVKELSFDIKLAQLKQKGFPFDRVKCFLEVDEARVESFTLLDIL